MSIDVVTEAMRGHADKLDTIAASGKEGVEAGTATLLNGEAFGVICSFIGAALVPVQSAGVVNSQIAVTGISGTANTVRALATVFDEVDEAVNEFMNVFRNGV